MYVCVCVDLMAISGFGEHALVALVDERGEATVCWSVNVLKQAMGSNNAKTINTK